MRNTVKFLTNIFPPRNYANPVSLEIVADYIRYEFYLADLETSYENFIVNNIEYCNVIGSVNSNKKNRIIICAHYDVCGNLPGADDNASSIAVLIESARLISKIADEIDFRVDFVALSLEEPPFFGTENMGSYIYAKNLFDAKANVEIVINLEMVGYFTNEPKSQSYPFAWMSFIYPSVGDFLAIVSNPDSKKAAREATVVFKNNIRTIHSSLPKLLQNVVQSDNINFWRFGFKSIMLTDTAYYRNKNYHTKYDTIDTLDFENMRNIANSLSEYISVLKKDEYKR